MIRNFFITLAALMFGATANASDWTIDQAHSNIGFTVTHMMVSTVHGSFGKYEGKISFDPSKPESVVGELSIDVNSINTGVEKRDNHLRTGDFFAVDSFPKIIFQTKKVTALGGSKYKVIGDMTIRGVTKEITLNGEGFGNILKNPWDKTVTSVSLRGKINRQDFGVNWNVKLDAGGVVVSDEVNLEIDLELTKIEG